MLPFGIIVALTVLILDQISKHWMLHAYKLPERAPVEITPFLNMDMVWNTGISFGMLGEFGVSNAMALIILAVFICAALVAWMAKIDDRFLTRAIGMVLGGAMGNIVDRYHFGAVFDFIDLHIGNYHWPAFNIADAAIVIGVGLIILDSIWNKPPSPNAS